MFARSLALAAGPALCVVLLSACTGTTPAAPAASSSASAPAPTDTAYAPSSSAPAGADAATLALKMADTSLGSIVVDGKGMTLYMFAPDTRNVSNCEGPCLAAWPPVLLPKGGTLADVKLEASGLRRLLLGQAMRADGTAQVTYNGWPLYYWVKDTKPGDVTGQNVNAVWFVLDRDGDAVKK